MGREVGQLWGPARMVLRPIFTTLWDWDVTGLEGVPPTGGVVVAANHLSVFDHFALGTVMPRRITFVGKSEYLDDWKTRQLFPALGMIPIERCGGDKSEGALRAAAGLLEQGELFGIYPEGTRSRDGRLHRGRTGVARLALRTGSPILPVGLIGTLEVQAPDQRVPRPRRPIRVHIGEPIQVHRDPAAAEDHPTLRALTDEVMHRIRELSGQTYVDEYAAR